jgi:hypothetical protein
MRFYWKALVVAFCTAAGVIGFGYLLGDHKIPPSVLGFFIAVAVFAEGVDHLTEKANEIIGAIEKVEESVKSVEEGVQELAVEDGRS